MSINFLEMFLMSQLSAIAIIFFRTSSALMVMPGFGDVYVPMRIRLLFALVFSLLLMPLLGDRMPALPASGYGLGLIVLSEVMIGLFMGLIARTVLSALHVAGSVIAAQSSLAVAAIFDPTNGAQSPVISNILSLAAITLFFTTDMHHLVLAALVQSYDVFEAGTFAPLQDMNILHVRMVADAFNLGVALSAPFIVMSLLFYLAGGLMTRLMPNFQVFFVMMSPQIMIAFFLLMALTGTILNIFMNFMEEQYMNFVVSQ